MTLTSKEKSARFRTAHPHYDRDRVAVERANWFLGKKCEWCGSDRLLELDHIDPGLKVSHRIFSWKPQRRATELAKCRVLCRFCHREHSRQQQLKPLIHGTMSAYGRRGCRCCECKRASVVYRAERKAKWLNASST